MTTPVSLVKVGNSRAFIIPAKILKQMNVKENSEFELLLDEESNIQIRKISEADNIVFPKIDLTSLSCRDIREFMDNLVIPDKEDIEKDERMAYILGK